MATAKESYNDVVAVLDELLNDDTVTDSAKNFIRTAKDGFQDAFASDSEIEPVNGTIDPDAYVSPASIDPTNPDFTEVMQAMERLTDNVHYIDSLNEELVHNVIGTLEAWNPSDLTT